MKRLLYLVMASLVAVLAFASIASAQGIYSQNQMMQPQAPAPAPVTAAPAPAAASQYMEAPAVPSAPVETQSQLATTVSIEDFFFSPAQITVEPGTTVTGVNNGAAPHTVTADDGSFGSEVLEPGESFSFTFQNPGTFAFHCQIHPGMTGSVTVSGAQALPSTGGSFPLLPIAALLLLGSGVIAALAVRRRAA